MGARSGGLVMKYVEIILHAACMIAALIFYFSGHKIEGVYWLGLSIVWLQWALYDDLRERR